MNKEIILKEYGKGQFSSFLSNDNTGMILDILDPEGIEILKTFNPPEERINYILVYSKYANELFKKDYFIKYFLSTDISEYYANLHMISLECNYILLEEAIKENKEPQFIAKLFSYFNSDNKIEILKNWKYSNDLLYEIFKYDFEHVGVFILDNFDIDLDSHGINVASILEIGKVLSLKDSASRASGYGNKETLTIDENKITNSLLEKLWSKNNVFEFREIVNNAYYSLFPEKFEKFAEKKEEALLYNASKEGLIEPFKSIYDHIMTARCYDADSDEWNKEMNTVYMLMKGNKDLFKLLFSYSIKGNDDSILDALKIQNDRYVSNYIVDYLFKEHYYNVMADLGELLNFYFAGNIDLPEDRISFYDKIYNIDELSLEEKMNLFETGISFNVVEAFYDDMSFARDIVGQAIKDSSITRSELEQYENEELTKKYGVPVYEIKDNPFFALVKSGRVIDNDPTGHSFSLIGCGCVGTFDLPSNGDTFIYDMSEFNPRQLVHVFPADSYTLYQPFRYTAEATRRVETLMTPEELLYETRFYNELLILERGKRDTSLDARIPIMEKMAVFALDEINDEHVRSAQANGVGIFLVNSNDYAKSPDLPDSIYRHQNFVEDYSKYNYFRGSYDRDEHESKRI